MIFWFWRTHELPGRSQEHESLYQINLNHTNGDQISFILSLFRSLNELKVLSVGLKMGWEKWEIRLNSSRMGQICTANMGNGVVMGNIFLPRRNLG